MGPGGSLAALLNHQIGDRVGMVPGGLDFVLALVLGNRHFERAPPGDHPASQVAMVVQTRRHHPN